MYKGPKTPVVVAPSYNKRTGVAKAVLSVGLSKYTSVINKSHPILGMRILFSLLDGNGAGNSLIVFVLLYIYLL